MGTVKVTPAGQRPSLLHQPGGETLREAPWRCQSCLLGRPACPKPTVVRPPTRAQGGAVSGERCGRQAVRQPSQLSFSNVTHARGQQCNCCFLSGALWGLAQCSAWNHGSGKAWWWVMSHRNLKIPSPPLSGCAWPQLMPIQSWLPVHGSKASLFGAPLKEP